MLGMGVMVDTQGQLSIQVEALAACFASIINNSSKTHVCFQAKVMTDRVPIRSAEKMNLLGLSDKTALVTTTQLQQPLPAKFQASKP